MRIQTQERALDTVMEISREMANSITQAGYLVGNESDYACAASLHPLGQSQSFEVSKGRADKRGAMNLHAFFVQFLQQVPLIVAAVYIPRFRAFEVAPPVPTAFGEEGAEFPRLAMQLKPQGKRGAGQAVELAFIGHGRN